MSRARPLGGSRTCRIRVYCVIDLKLVRENPDAVRRSQLSRGEDPSLVDVLLAADTARRAAIAAADTLRAEQKAASKKVGSAAPDQRPALLEEAKHLAAQVKQAEARQAEAESAFATAHTAIPNVIIDGVPAGGEDDYVVLEVVGEPPVIDQPRDHVEIGEALGLIDTERGAKVSGARFYFLTGNGALLQLGLLQLAVHMAVRNGFTVMIPPVLVRPEVMAGTGFLGAHADEVYRVESEDLFLVGTSEVPLAGYHADEILDLSAGPLRYAGRRVSAGKRAVTARTPGASSGSISSTRSRRSSTAVPKTPRTSTVGYWAGSGRCSRRSRCPTGSSTWRPAISAPRRPGSSTARRGCPPSRPTGS